MADLDDYRALVASILMDPNHQSWDLYSLDQNLKLALAEFSRYLPQKKEKEATLTADGRSFDLTAAPFSLTDFLWAEELYWPYDEDEYPYTLVAFEIREQILYVTTQAEPESGDVMLLRYCATHTIEDLDSATATSILSSWMPLLCTGAAAYATLGKGSHLGAKDEDASKAAKVIEISSTRLMKAFRDGLAAIVPSTIWASWGSPSLPAGV